MLHFRSPPKMISNLKEGHTARSGKFYTYIRALCFSILLEKAIVFPLHMKQTKVFSKSISSQGYRKTLRSHEKLAIIHRLIA
ncbi:hypothetical protein CQ062_16535 [Ochrobactrum sp. MYb68]|nr:hypothetical protein CQ062_16535 [Ochrobactrum sp. MYb68]